VVSYYINQNGYDNIKIVGTTPFKNSGIGLVVNPEWKTFRDITDKVFQSVSPKEDHAIRKKWIGQKNGFYFTKSFVLWCALIIMVIIICAFIAYYWNRKLQNIVQRKKESEQHLKSSLLACFIHQKINFDNKSLNFSVLIFKS